MTKGALTHPRLLALDPQALPAVGAIPATAHLSLVTSIVNLAMLKDDWQQLEAQCQRPVSVFQSFDWVMAWCETYASTGAGPQIHVLTGYDEGRLVFVFPLMKVRSCGLNIIKWLTDPFGQYGDILCAKGQCPRHWMVHALALLRRLNDVDLLWLRHVRDDSHMAAHAAELMRDAHMNERAPYLDLTQYDGEPAYDARYSSVQRKRRKKIRNRIASHGEVEFASLPAGSLADSAISEAISEKNKWLAERARMNRVLRCSLHPQFLRRLSRRQGTVETVVTQLSAGGKPVSWEIGIRQNGVHFAYITSHVNALTDLSPGRLHMDLSQRNALNGGMTRFDLMVPYDAYKESWSSGFVMARDYHLPISALGWVAGVGYLQSLRPWLRRLYYKAHPLLARLQSRFRDEPAKIPAADD